MKKLANLPLSGSRTNNEKKYYYYYFKFRLKKK